MYHLVIQLKIHVSNTEWQKWHDAYSELLHLQVSSYELIKVNWIINTWWWNNLLHVIKMRRYIKVIVCYCILIGTQHCYYISN